MTRPTRKLRTAVFLLASALVVSACGGGSEAEDAEAINVVATTTILGDVAANIVGDEGTVTTLLPIGASPHDYQPSAQQTAAIVSADLVIANGLGLEEGLSEILTTAVSDGATVLTLGPLLDPLPFAGDGHDHDDEHGADEGDILDHDDDHSDSDPHIWLDPSRMAEAGRLIANQLGSVDESIDWMARADDYATELIVADEEIVEILATIAPAQRKLVTNHDSFGYFASRYQFDVVGIVIPGGSTLADPSSAELSELIEEIDRQQVPAIFAETSESSAVATAIAAESGTPVEVVELFTGSLGEDGSGAETLIDLLLTNARRIAAALS